MHTSLSPTGRPLYLKARGVRVCVRVRAAAGGLPDTRERAAGDADVVWWMDALDSHAAPSPPPPPPPIELPVRASAARTPHDLGYGSPLVYKSGPE